MEKRDGKVWKLSFLYVHTAHPAAGDGICLMCPRGQESAGVKRGHRDVSGSEATFTGAVGANTVEVVMEHWQLMARLGSVMRRSAVSLGSRIICWWPHGIKTVQEQPCKPRAAVAAVGNHHC